jgi:hypothetical protein
LALAAVLAAGGSLRADEPFPMNVLYAGNPGSDRERDFKNFLEKHFAKVGTTDFEKFTPAESKGYDVVIFDWTSIYPREKDGTIKKEISGLNSPKIPKLTDAYDRPTILIGAAGGFVAQSLRLKIDWR